MRPNCNFLKAELNRPLNTVCSTVADEAFPYRYSILSWRGRVWQGWDLFLIRTEPIFEYPTSGGVCVRKLMAEFHEKSNKNDQSSRNNREGTDSEEGQEELKLFSAEKWRERSDMMSAFKSVFSDTSRPARQRTGNCLTSVFTWVKARKNVLSGDNASTTCSLGISEDF